MLNGKYHSEGTYNGRRVIVDLAALPGGRLEVMAMYKSSGTEIDVQFQRDLFSPPTEVHSIIAFSVSGANYQDRKNRVRETAVRFQNEQQPGLSWGELCEIGAWFETMGKRYGLLREFRENGIV